MFSYYICTFKERRVKYVSCTNSFQGVCRFRLAKYYEGNPPYKLSEFKLRQLWRCSGLKILFRTYYILRPWSIRPQKSNYFFYFYSSNLFQFYVFLQFSKCLVCLNWMKCICYVFRVFRKDFRITMNIVMCNKMIFFFSIVCSEVF